MCIQCGAWIAISGDYPYEIYLCDICEDGTEEYWAEEEEKRLREELDKPYDEKTEHVWEQEL